MHAPIVHPFTSIALTGASSGLGAALARALAAPGVHLFLSGRHAQRLETVADRVRAQGAEATPCVLDVTDRAAVEAWITTSEATHPLDLVIANAGISLGTASAPPPSGETSSGGGAANALPSIEDPDQIDTVLATNLSGAIHTVLPALPAMRQRQRGQIGVVASLAGFRGWAGAPTYCASKAGLRCWGEGMRGVLRADGVGLSIINPGFVRTPMTDVNDFAMPLLWESDRAAVHIIKRLARNQGHIAFPWPLLWAARCTQILPQPVVDWLQDQLPRKPRGS